MGESTDRRTRTDVDVVAFRRALRRAAADFLGLRSTEAQYLAAVRRAAVAAGVIAARRPTRADRILRSLAWGAGSTPPGTLPAVMEPYLVAYEEGRLTEDELGRRIGDALDQVVIGDGR